jgi:hypothetical protein
LKNRQVAEDAEDPQHIELTENFLLGYRKIRNLMMVLTVESVTTRRSFHYIGRDNHDAAVVLLKVLRRLVSVMEDNQLSPEMAKLFSVVIEESKTIADVCDAASNLARQLPDSGRDKYHTSGDDIDHWCRYVRKLMGVYNVPIPIPEEELARRAKAAEMRAHFGRVMQDVHQQIKEEMSNESPPPDSV